MVRLYGKSIGANKGSLKVISTGPYWPEPRRPVGYGMETAHMLPDGGVGDVQAASKPTGRPEYPSLMESGGVGH